MTRLRFALLVVVALVLASCGSGAIVEDVVLVSRVGRVTDVLSCEGEALESLCVVRVEGIAMRTPDGRTAVSEPAVGNWGPVDDSSCPSNAFGPRDPQIPASVFVFEDGARVELYTHTFCQHFGSVDESGEWRGVGGSFSGESGSYQFTYDGLQSELILVPS